MPKKIPTRQCIGCQEMKQKTDLIRIVHKTDDTFSIDVTGKMNGRGAYICKSSACLSKAIKSKGLERSFKQQIPADVYEALKKELEAIE